VNGDEGAILTYSLRVTPPAFILGG